jgi:hypothetical protein
VRHSGRHELAQRSPERQIRKAGAWPALGFGAWDLGFGIFPRQSSP